MLSPVSTAIDPMTGQLYPGGVFIGGYGPPLDNNTRNTDGAVGGNPTITPYLNPKKWPFVPPLDYEAGWKDTVIMYPGRVTHIRVRWAPTHFAANNPPADLSFPFDPNGGYGYVWYCNIIDHEDKEMMRPTSVDTIGSTTNPGTPTRNYFKGTDY